MVKLPADVRMRVNDALHNMCKRRHRSIPLSDITSLLATHGLKVEECILTGRIGNAKIDVLTIGGQDVNSWLVLSWVKGDIDHQWEVNAYLS
jgi:hypothetical protein